MSQPVPKLDLAPKLKRSLSLWNPLDYLRLLYWVFYFPQAIRWYWWIVARNDLDSTDAQTFIEKIRKRLQQKSDQSSLWVQGIILQIALPILVCSCLAEFGAAVNWTGVHAIIIFSIGVSLLFVSDASAPTLLIIPSLVSSVFVGSISTPIIDTINSSDWLAAPLVYLFSWFVTYAAGAICVAFTYQAGVPINKLNIASSLGVSTVVGVCFGIIVGALIKVHYGINIGIVSISIFLRPENWLLGYYFRASESYQQLWLIPRVTPLPIPFIAKKLRFWLEADWENGLHNANEFLQYTLQFVPVTQAINLALVKTPPEILILRVSQLADMIWDRIVLEYASASITNRLKSDFVEGLFILPSSLKARLLKNVDTFLKLDSLPRATAAGFWLLFSGQPDSAIEAFSVVRSLPHGEEMLTISQFLADCIASETLEEIAEIQIHSPSLPLLRPHTWELLKKLHIISGEIQVVQNAVSRAAKAFASNRALGELTSILGNSQDLPSIEGGLVIRIAESWQSALLKVAGEIGIAAITAPVQNPYITGDPVEGSLFVGRDDILRQLEELWFINAQLQSVVLYGHRRMGKTSLLRNVNTRLGSTTQLVYVNLLNLGEVTHGTGEVLLSICDEIAQATHHPAPTDTDLLTLPELTFKRYLQSLIESPDSKGLIIALDEFEQLEALINTGKLSPTFLSYLRGLVQMSPKIAFVFAGLHTLEEMTADYFSPFFASVIPIRLSFLDRASTRQLLANPSDEFPLDYAPEVYDAIFDLTAGQPYLVQLLGFQLVRRYNTQVFEQGRARSHQFSIDDLQAITTDPDLFIKGRYYFTGVWQQAKQAPPGQQAILRAIALEGLPRSALLQHLDAPRLDTAIESLCRHDVIHKVDQTWCIKVELFRRWVIKYAIDQ